MTDIYIYQRGGLYFYEGRDASGRKVSVAVPEDGFPNRAHAKRAAHARFRSARIR